MGHDALGAHALDKLEILDRQGPPGTGRSDVRCNIRYRGISVVFGGCHRTCCVGDSLCGHDFASMSGTAGFPISARLLNRLIGGVLFVSG